MRYSTMRRRKEKSLWHTLSMVWAIIAIVLNLIWLADNFVSITLLLTGSLFAVQSLVFQSLSALNGKLEWLWSVGAMVITAILWYLYFFAS